MIVSRLECSFCADRERDDLMSALVSARGGLADARHREASACEQVKQAVRVAEEANFEKTKASLRFRFKQRRAMWLFFYFS